MVTKEHPEVVPLRTQLVPCQCGVQLRVAGMWTYWRCGTCHRLFEREDPDA